MGLGLILEAQCDVTAELGRFELADETVADSRAFAARAQLEALPFYADRLDGRAALARGDGSRALETLARAWDGFGALGAPGRRRSRRSGLARRNSLPAKPAMRVAARRKRSTSSTTSAPFASASSRGRSSTAPDDGRNEAFRPLVIHNRPRLGNWALTL